MSCQYLVNGKLISEDEFKQVLNNGLLDNLIDSKVVSLKGFPLDENKLLSNRTEEKKVLKSKSVDAKVLRKILLKEITTRSGYPLNMKSALELNETKTDFKIPLWSSPYADKFESLLTSLVSNKVVRQKFAGHSYILGSQEGFKIKKGADANKELAKSGIVFSKNFDPVEGLQPMRPDPITGKMLPAQIMVPFMFRDEDGNILKLEQFAKKDENGRWIVDTDRVPEKILNLFGFRIPTQEQNSMAFVEIVGFLPEESGDLILAPRDFTNQMGSDFDVDKLFTYMYNTYYKDGKLHTDFSNNLEDISNKLTEAERELNALYVDLNLTRDEIEFIKEFTEDKKNFIEENKELLKGEANNIKLSEFILTLRRDKQKAYNIKDEIKYRIDKLGEEINILNRSYVAANQNKILDIHQQIMLSTNPDVIKSIMSVDSFGEFEGLAADIFKTRKEKGLVSPIITILSDTYQRDKYMNAAAGKAATGTFSLDSTFNATSQGKELVYVNLPLDARMALFSKDTAPSTEEILKANNPISTFGDISSQGDMSNKYTLASQKLIKENGGKVTDAIKDKLKLKSTIIRSLQSSAVDAEKAQILDKLNINDETFDATRALSILGFEENDIVGLLTQDIIWEYVDRLKDGKSSLKNYNPNLSEDIKNSLREKYDPEKRLEELSDADIERFNKLTDISGKDLINIIKTESFTPEKSTDHNLIQYFLLDKFLKLSDIGVDIKKLQSAINTESKGVPKSIIEATTKLRQINNIGTGPIFNAENLLGDYTSTPTGKYLSTPTTVNGFASFYGTKVATEIFNKYFPYNKSGFKETVSEVIYHSQGEETVSTSKQTEIAKDVFKNMRSYLFSNNNTGLFTGMASEERARLFIDVKDKNESLASILNKLSNQKWFIENGFLNKLTFNLNSNGDISRINFDAAAGENFDEKNIYLGFISLLDKNVPLGKFNGIDYTSRSLAQDLVMAAFLEGGNQGSKQYLKYIPSSYLKSINFGRYLSGIDFNFENTFGGIILDEGFDPTIPSKFTRQYFQNNPSKVKSVTLENIANKPKEVPEQFQLNAETMKNNFRKVIINGEEKTVQTQFLSIFDSKVPGKYALYEYDVTSGIYKRIPTLAGDYGFKQYDPLTDNATSVIEKQPYNKKNTVEQLPPEYIPPSITEEGPIKNNLPSDQPRQDLRGKELVNDILNKLETNSKVSSYNKELIGLLRTMPNLEDINIVIDNTSDAVGSYSVKDGVRTITLNYSKIKELEFTQNKIASTVIHELIHAYSSTIIRLYQNNKLDKLTPQQINIVQKLEKLQQEYTNKLIQEGNKDALITFHNKYWQSKYNAGKITKELLDYHIKKGPQGLGSTTAEVPLDYNPASLSKYYGAIKLEEFVTMALTDEGFQKLLNETPTGEPLPFWQELVKLLTNLLEAGLGIKINPDSILPSAIEESLNLLKTNISGITPSTPTNINPILPSTQSIKRKTYSGKVTSLQPNQIFVFGSNPEGRHGAGAAKYARDNFGAIYGQGEGLQGQSYALPTKDLRVKENNSLKSISPEDITSNIRKLYDVARQNPTKEFLVSDYSETNLNGYTGQEMADMFINAGVIPNNIVFHENFNKLISTKPTTQPTEVKEGVQELFNSNSELASIGTPIQYSQYLDSIFPDSKVKDIVYHGTGEGNKIEKLNNRTYFSNLLEASRYAAWDLANREQYAFEQGTLDSLNAGIQIIPAVINLKNPKYLQNQPYAETEKDYKGYDGIYSKETIDPLGGQELQIVVNTTNQIHILGNKQDIKEFKSFISKTPTSISTMPNDAYQYYGARYEIIRDNNGKGIDVVGYKGSNTNKEKLLSAYNENPNVDPQNGKLFRAETNPQEVPSNTELENVDAKYELFPGVYANSGQRIAIDLLTDFLSSPDKAFLLQGKGGTGKTTIIKKIVEEAQKEGTNILGIAPTHKAKKVLGNSIKTIKTTTLASSLAIKLDESTGKFTPDEFARSRGKVPIKNAQLIIIDESSMISDKLLQEIKQMAPPNAKIIFMGDRAQLPPVGQESDSKVFDINNGYELTEKMRQAATSPIINIGTKVAANVETTGQRVANPIETSDRNNQIDPISGSSILWETNEARALDSFVDDLREAAGDVNYAKIVTFNNQLHDNPQSVKNLNLKIRERLFGNDASKFQFMPGEILTAYDTYGEESPEFYNSEDLIVKEAKEEKNRTMTVTATSAAKGVRSIDITLDLVMLTLINEEGKLVNNIPVVANSSKNAYRETVNKLFKTDPQLAYALQNKFANLEYGYAITSHKAQGSTYKNVYVMEDNIMGPSNGGNIKAKNQSLYVAVSRPSTKLVMVSNKNGNTNISTAPTKTFDISNIPLENLEDMRNPDKSRYYDDYENYKDMLGYNDELVDPRMLNPEEVEKFKLLCKK